MDPLSGWSQGAAESNIPAPPNDTHTGCPVNRLPGSLYLYPQFFVNGSGSEPSDSGSVPAVPGQPSSP